MTEPAPQGTRAEKLYESWIARWEMGEPVGLDSLCEANPQDATELRRLHAACEQLERLLPGPLDAESPADALLGRLRTTNTRGARYVEQGEVARGGMGVVLRVWDDELERPLAMKIARHQRDGGHLLRRFLTEARITGQLEHPGIVPVHEVGLRADGSVYFTMRLIEGEDLRAVFDMVRRGDGGWTLARAVGVLLQVCDAMRYAHGKQIIHRDLKPANVMVGRFGEVYVVDWGLARVLDFEGGDAAPRQPESDAGGASVTQVGDVLGTPHYMAPEQARGDVDLLGPQCDVYSVGAMLYQLLSGELPYAEAGEPSSSTTVLDRVRTEAPRQLDRTVPAELAAICERAMARDPKARYPTMQALAEDLRAFTEGRVVAAFETGGWAETRKWVRRNPGFALAVVAVVVLTLVAAGLVVWAESAVARAAEQRADAELPLATRADVGRLLVAVDAAWPPHPERLTEYESWFREARELTEGRPQRAARARRPSLREWYARLSALQDTALPITDAREQTDRESHPRRAELDRLRNDLRWRSRMLALEPWTTEAAAALELGRWHLSKDPEGLLQLADAILKSDSAAPGCDVEARLLARRALAAMPRARKKAARITLAWGHWRCGDLVAARAEIARLRDESKGRERAALETSLAPLEKRLAAWEGETQRTRQRRERDALAAQVMALEREVDARRTFEFESVDDAWRHEHLIKLIAGLERLRAPTGLASMTVAEPFGWGMKRRLEFARTIGARSCDGPTAKAAWDRAIAAIRASDEYTGLELVPQMGLFPIGPDPDSGLWEFAHLQSGAKAVRKDGRLVVDDAMGLVLVLIPGGRFRMGASLADRLANNIERPAHEVTLSPFFFSKYEMTQSQWRRIAGRDPSYFDPRRVYGSKATHPVENMSWDDCQTQLHRLGLILPSEAQWEYACRAGTRSRWWTGDRRESLRGKVNLADQTAKSVGMRWPAIAEWPDLEDGYVASAPIGKFAANPFGLHEVHGNVAEWCQDDHAQYRLLAQKDPIISAGLPVRVYRGGSHINGPSNVRVSSRTYATPNYRSGAVGVRPARPVELTR